MFDAGTRIEVIENGLTGTVEKWLTEIWEMTIDYHIRWDHDSSRVHKYNFVDHAEAQKVWRPARNQAPQYAISYGINKLPSSLDFIPITIKIGDVKIAECSHVWADYHGFTDSYTYCKKCDVKQT